MDDPERDARVALLLEHCVGTELTVINAVLELGLADDVIEQLKEGVVSEVLNGFAVDWSPRWVGPNGVHSWQEPIGWMARCSSCLVDSPPAASREDAVAWARQHEASH